MLAPADIIIQLAGEPQNAYQALLLYAATPPHQRNLSAVAKSCGVARVTPGRWRDTWDWNARLDAYDKAVSNPLSGPLTRALAASERPPDAESRAEIDAQVRAYRAQVLESADALQVIALAALSRVSERLNALTPQEIEKMSIRDACALANTAMAAVKQAQASKGDIFGLTEFLTYLEQGGREAIESQVSHRSNDAEAE